MRLGVVAVLALVTACSGDPAPVPSPTPTARATPAPRAPLPPPVLRPGQVAVPELDAAVPLAGTWRFQASATGAAALYEQGDAAIFAIRCDPRARRVLFATLRGEGRALRLYTDTSAATYPTRLVDGVVEAAAGVGDTFLDSLARASAIGVQLDDGPVARLAGDDAIGTVVRSCRPGGGRG